MKKEDKDTFTEAEMKIIRKINDGRKVAETRFPITTGLAATFGFVCVLYGFEKIIDKFAFFENNPYLLFFVGMLILLGTGTVYKKLN